MDPVQPLSEKREPSASLNGGCRCLVLKGPHQRCLWMRQQHVLISRDKPSEALCPDSSHSEGRRLISTALKAGLPPYLKSLIQWLQLKLMGGGRFDEAIGSTQNRMGKTQPWASVFPCPLFLSVAVINYLVSSMASEEVFVTQQECSGFFKVAWLQVKGSSVSPTVPWAATHLNTGPSGPSVWLKEAKGDGWLALSVFSLCC